MNLRFLLDFAKKNGASELHMTPDGPIELLVKGKLEKVNVPRLRRDDHDAMIRELISSVAPERSEELWNTRHVDATFDVPNFGTVHAKVAPGKAVLSLGGPAPPASSARQPDIDTVAEYRQRRRTAINLATPWFLVGIFGGCVAITPPLDNNSPWQNWALAAAFAACLVRAAFIATKWNRCPRCNAVPTGDEGATFSAMTCQHCGARLQ